MKMSTGKMEDGIEIGNHYDKYKSTNILAKKIMQGFETTITELIDKTKTTSIYDVGCGEGYWVIQWNKKGIPTRGCDFSEQVIDIARKNAIEAGEKPELFEVCSIYDLTPEKINSELICCCEVLEHLENPEDALKVLQKVVSNYLIVSVPREPLWKILNILRCKYITSGGNTPGHIQAWSKTGFINLISKYFEIIEVRNPLPWTMLLCRPYNKNK